MVIRKGRNESMDKLVTYILLAAFVAAVIGVFVFLAKKNPGGGMFWQYVAIDETNEISALKYIRIPVPLDAESKKAKKIVVSVEVKPTGADVDFGLVHRGRELANQNLVGERISKSYARAPAGRRVNISDSTEPGDFDVVIQNLSDRKASVYVVVTVKKP